jgi:hypothetical protein
VSLGGVGNALRLVVEGASPVIVIGGVLCLAASLATRGRRRNSLDDSPGRGHAAWLLFAPALLVTIQFVLLANGKPPEYARFGLLPDTVLLVATFTGIARLRTPGPRTILAAATTILLLGFAFPYVRAFVRDAGTENTRSFAARMIRDRGPATVYVTAEPAPYCLPPVDLFRTRLLLSHEGPTVRVTPERSRAPVSWADTPFTLSSSRMVGATTVSSP